MPKQSRKTILLAADQQGSVLNALHANLAHARTYTPYGHYAHNGLLSLLGFNGELMDTLTGHYHLGKGYRPFSPVLMRFICPDSWCPFGKGGLNAYAYCGGDPMNQVDPTGHFMVAAFIKSLKSAAAIHPSGVGTIKDSTKIAIYKAAEKFGGAPRVKDLAKQQGKIPETFLLEDVISRQAAKADAVFENASALTLSPAELLTTYKKLAKIKSVYMDILTGTKDSVYRPKELKTLHNQHVQQSNYIIRRLNETGNFRPVELWQEIRSQ